MSVVLLIGAARSGKSDLAVRIAHAWGGEVTFVATAEPRDAEMAERITRHRARRPARWETVEEPILIRDRIAAVAGDRLVILDCLTLWVANLLEHGFDAARVYDAARDTSATAAARRSPVVVVGNEVGAGIVPIEPSVREYRDVLGTVNRIFAEHAGEALLVAAGRALPLRRPEEVISLLLAR